MSSIKFPNNKRCNSNLRPNPYFYFKRQTLSPLFSRLITNQHNQKDDSCLYLHQHCLQNRLEGYNYCIRHILNDRNAPFKQCSYVHPTTNRRCPNAARKLDRREKDTVYCPSHIKQFNLLRRKNECLKNSVFHTTTDEVNNPRQNKTDTIRKRKFEELEHYCPSYEHDHRRKNADWDLLEDKCVVTSKFLKTKLKESVETIHCQNQDDDDFSNPTFGDVLNLDSMDSDNETVESYMEDPLRHASVFCKEELVHIFRNKTLRLQALYISLLKYYREVFKNKMRQFYLSKTNIGTGKTNDNKNNIISAATNEPSTSSQTTTIDPLKEMKDNKILKAMFKYQNISGVEKLLQIKASKMRQSSINEPELESKKPSKFSHCVYKKDNEVCLQQCMPLTNYCRTHILYDQYQVLYRPCGEGSPPCLVPLTSYIHMNSCVKHKQLKHDKRKVSKILEIPAISAKPKQDEINNNENLNITNNNNNITNTDNNNDQQLHDNVTSLNNDNEPLSNVIENDSELYSSMVEDISMVMDNVESGNFFEPFVPFDPDSNI